MASPSPTLLAIDTATGPCSVAVWKDGRVDAYIENIKPTQQSASLMPMVEEVLRQAGIDYTALDGVVCTTGPGSFTGIRVGLASASGIAFAAKISGAGVTTLEVLAFASLAKRTHESTLLAVLNAGKGEFYFQAFSALPFAPISELRVGTLAEAADLVVGNTLQSGNAPLAAAGFSDAATPFPRADALAAFAAQHAPKLALRPTYIRAPDAKLPGGKLLDQA